MPCTGSGRPTFHTRSSNAGDTSSPDLVHRSHGWQEMVLNHRRLARQVSSFQRLFWIAFASLVHFHSPSATSFVRTGSCV